MLKVLGVIIIGSLIVFSGWMAVIVTDRSSPVGDAVTEAVPGVVVPGGSFQLDISIFYFRSCYAYISRDIYDAKGNHFIAPNFVLPPSGRIGEQHSASLISTPLTIAHGEARIISHPRYGCNFLQRWFWPVSVPDRITRFIVVSGHPADPVLTGP